MPQATPDDDRIRAILERARTIALVGASARPERPSHAVMAFLQHHGYRVIPVNPGLAGQALLGETVVASLRDVAEPVDMVDIFRAPEQVAPIVDDAVAIGASTVWMQLGVVNEAAGATARAAGLAVVMDRCPKIEIAPPSLAASVSATAPPLVSRDSARAHRLGVLLMLASALAFSSAGFFTRLITLDAPALLFWRGIFSGLTIAAFVAWRQRGAVWATLRTLGWQDLLLALTSSCAMISFVWSLRLSSVAEVSVIYATVPLGTAALGWLLLREPAGWPVLAACGVVFAGMAIMMSGGQAQAHLFGDVVAVLMTAISALFMVGLRWRRHAPVEPAVAASAFLTSVLVAAWAHPLSVSPHEIGVAALFGITQNGCGIILMVLGSRYVTANETALYGALDAPLAPLWVWLAFAEAPSLRTLLGGAVILAAVGAFIAQENRTR